jgi:predicted nuclease of predicted toxin-antitoxin system
VADRIRFYFDQHIPVAVADGLRRRGVDVLTAQEADRCGLPDLRQIEFAKSDQRITVTFDDDFLALAAGDIPHAGIAFCRATKYSIGELIHALLLLNDVLNMSDMQNHIEFL